jgi:8-oxo-dGTP pyrophosphatase MutT (NUDIX family)
VKERDEMYPLLQRWGDAPLAQVDRVAVPWFGIRAFGVHVNGYVRKADGLYLWIAERAMDRLIDPGKLDNIIGGGQPIGLSVEENLAKEAGEEAGVSANMIRNAKAAGTLSYKTERMRGLRNDTLFVYDMEFQPDFMPRNTDGEVGKFHLMPITEVAALVRDTDRFKFNCNLVIIDFLLRQGFFAENGTEYAELSKAMQPLKIQPLP